MLDVELRPRAQLDIESIYIHITVTLSSPTAAENIVGKIYESVERLAEFPDLGSAFVDAGISRAYRRMLCGRYWIYYTHDARTLTIWRVFHVRQDIDDYTYVGL